MIVDRIHSRWWLTLNGLIRHAMVYGVPGCGPSKTVLTEYPRSGGTWVCQMIAEHLGIANTRNRLPRGSWLRIHSMTWPQFVDAWKNQHHQSRTCERKHPQPSLNSPRFGHQKGSSW